MMAPRSPLPLLLADIGGTTTRLACAGADGVPVHVRIEANDHHATLEDLLLAYLHDMGELRPPVAVLALACPVEGEDLRLTNRDWRISRPRLKAALGLSRLELVNDFVALAHGVPGLGAGDYECVGVPPAGERPQGAILVCGPGTGLGAALILPREGPEGSLAFEVLPSEAGHMRFGATSAEEARVLAHLERDLGPVCVEHVLSGPGLGRIHAILSGAQLSPRAIIVAALEEQGQALESCHLFLGIFGRVLGDLALAFEARGGVYIAGGLGQALAPLAAHSPLRAAFESHPPFEGRLAQVPLRIITHPTPGLAGAGYLGRALLQNL